MKNFSYSIFSLVILITVILSCSSDSPQTPKNDQDYVPGQLMVQFTTDTNKEQIDSLLTHYNLTHIRILSNILNIHLIGVSEGEEQAWIKKLEKNPMVELIQLNHKGIELRR